MKDTYNVEPDVVSYTTAITACGNDWEAAMGVLTQAEASDKVEKDARLYTATMRVCGAAGKREKVLELFERMKAVTTPSKTTKTHTDTQQTDTHKEDRLSDYIAYNSVLEALKVQGDWQQALKVLKEMHTHANLVPNTVNHNVCLDALAEAGESEEVGLCVCVCVCDFFLCVCE
jgi:pentatricopeptide repeat protein